VLVLAYKFPERMMNGRSMGYMALMLYPKTKGTAECHRLPKWSSFGGMYWQK
jgi:hypothetical protein